MTGSSDPNVVSWELQSVHFDDLATTGQFGEIKAMPLTKGPGSALRSKTEGMPHIERASEVLQEMMDEHAYDRPSNRISSTNTVYVKRPLP